MGKTLKYVKEFDFGPQKTHVKPYMRGGPVKCATGGAVQTSPRMAQTPAPRPAAQGAMNAMRDQAARTQQAAQQVRAAKSAPAQAAPRQQTMADRYTMEQKLASGQARGLKRGDAVSPAKVGQVMGEYKAGTLHSGKNGPVVKSRPQAMAIAMAQGRKVKQ